MAACGHGGMVTPQFGTPVQQPNAPGQSFDLPPQQSQSSDTWSDIHAFQVFDWGITSQKATADAHRYEVVWGTSKPGAWKAGNARIITSWYAPFDGDFTRTHDISWWKANHPDWVLYRCDRTRLAGLGGLSNVPLDISNPAVVRWQMQTYVPQIEADGYDALAEDLVGLNNVNGGCGVFVNGRWVQRFTGDKYDDKWTQAVIAWHHYAYNYLHSRSRPLLVGVNHVPENRPYGDPEEKDLLNHIDLEDDESSFTDYGNGYAPPAKVALILQWMKYVQGLGKQYIVDDKWNVQRLTSRQLDWSIATYLLGKDRHASLFVDHLPGYGYEYWYPQYNKSVGSPCSGTVSDPLHADVYYRKYSGAYVIVNASATNHYVVTLPRLSYQSIDGIKITSPLTMAPDDAQVLLSTNGCK